MDRENPRTGSGADFQCDAAALLAVLEEAPESLVVETPEGVFLYANRDARASIGVQTLAQIVGWQRREIDDHFELRDEGGRPLTSDLLTSVRALLEADPQEVTHVTSRATGQEHWRLVKSRAVRGEDGAPHYVVTTWHDLSQRRRIEAGLRLRAEAGRLLASSLDFQTTLRHLEQLVMPAIADAYIVDIVAEDGAIERAACGAALPEEDELAQGLRRYPPRWDWPHPVLKTLREGATLLYPELPPQVWEDVLAAAQDADHRALLLRLRHTSGLCVPLVARGQIFGALSLIMMASGRRYDRDDLELAEELGRLAGLSLDNARLYDQAQRAIHLRDEFLHVAAHELKTPLTSIRGFSQLALRQLRRGAGAGGAGIAEVLPAIERVDSGAQKLGRLVTQLLDISRLESGRLKLYRQPTDVAALLRSAVADFGGRESGADIRIRAPESLTCSCDPLRIEQVLLNLLDNAVKYGPEGGPVDVTLVGTGAEVRIEVRDQGLGVTPEHRDRIFDRFYRAHEESHTSGMGLGLFISREIIQLHGGRLLGDFPLEGGAGFIVELPMVPVDGAGESP